MTRFSRGKDPVQHQRQAIKRIILTGRYQGMKKEEGKSGCRRPSRFRERDGVVNAEELLAAYCGLLYGKFGTYEEVARRTRLDRRTAKKYAQMSVPAEL